MNEHCIAYRSKSNGAQDCWLYNSDVITAAAEMVPDASSTIYFVKCFTPEPCALLILLHKCYLLQ